MSNTWFAGNFCPSNAECSLEEGALSPPNGPKLRTLKMNEATNKTLTATVKSFESGTEPDGWLKCEGQMVYIGDQTALFSLLGTNYGGDGRASFGMPDLRNEDGDYFIYTLAFFQD